MNKEGGEIQMLNKKSIAIVTFSVLMVLACYTGLIFGFGESCLSLDAIGCMKFGESCLIYCQITIDDSYRLNYDVPILVVKDHRTQDIVIIEEMEYLGTLDHCDQYDCKPQVPCDAPYDVAVYINDTSGDPLLIAPVVVCP